MPHINQKRWISISGLGVVVATSIAAAAMTGSCVFGTTTNLCEQSGVRCKEGQECAAQQMACIDIGGCGDGITDRNKGEVCDDGNIVDGQIANGKFVLDDCSHDCKSDQRCGNSITDVGETCDDGDRNSLPDDGCDSNCHLKNEFCGNGIVDASLNEQCDPGTTDSAGCNSNQANNPDKLFNRGPGAGCKFSKCGDGYVNIAADEKCDSRGAITKDCNGPLCTIPVCGDNFHNKDAGEDCDNGNDDTSGCNGSKNGSNGPGNCKFPSCGDGYVNMTFKPPGSKLTETCDTLGGDSQTCNGDGNINTPLNNPDAKCQPAQCGDGYVNAKFTPKDAKAPENCDKGAADTEGCNGNNKGNNGPGSCRIPSCGDGYTNTMFTPRGATEAEECDNLDGTDTSTCNGNNKGTDGPGSCRFPSCGDGYVNKAFTLPGANGPEACDNLGGIDTMMCNGNTAGPASCQKPVCGDGYTNPAFTPPGSKAQPEQCDTGGNSPTCNGNDNETAAAKGIGDCQVPKCGDGYVNSTFKPDGMNVEQCDKGDPPNGIPSIPCSGQQGQQRCLSNCTCI